MKQKKRQTSHCSECGSLIKGRILDTKCESCYKRKFKKPIKIVQLICKHCSAEFLAKGSQLSQKKYCNDSCYKEYKKRYAKTVRVKSYKKQWAEENREKTRKSSLKSYLKSKKDPAFRIKCSL